MKKATRQDKEILAKQDDDTLAQWWCLLNRWGWPEELPNPEDTENSKGRRWNLMCLISNRIGDKRCNREWNSDRMTDEEHEAFWRRIRR